MHITTAPGLVTDIEGKVGNVKLEAVCIAHLRVATSNWCRHSDNTWIAFLFETAACDGKASL